MRMLKNASPTNLDFVVPTKKVSDQSPRAKGPGANNNKASTTTRALRAHVPRARALRARALRAYVRFESHNQIKFAEANQTLRRLFQAEEISPQSEQREAQRGLGGMGVVFLKKKRQLSLTVISGPHVHKKSRDQYKIDRYSGFFCIEQKSLSEQLGGSFAAASPRHPTLGGGKMAPAGMCQR